MINLSKKYRVAALLALCASYQAQAAFVLDGTRYIYNEGVKSIPVNVSNKSNALFGGQVWIDNTNQDASTVSLVPTPPFFRVPPEQRQLVRIMNVSNDLPTDRESLFKLNVQEVPPMATKEQGNALAFAMNTNVKIIYRPKALKKGRDNAEKLVKIERKQGDIYIRNPTPYYFAVINIKYQGKKLALTTTQAKNIATFKPYSEVKLDAAPDGKWSFDAVNDWGGVQTFQF